MSIAVVSSSYGGYDVFRPAPDQDVACDWLMVTDRPTEDAVGWDVIVEPRPHVHPRLAAKVAKFRPDHYTDADVIVWLDGHVIVQSPRFIRSLVEWLGDSDIAMFPHPARRSILKEATASAPLAKYQGQSVCRQADHYISLGHQHDWGLWATGVSVRRNNERTAALGDQWLCENTRWTYQDQISLPFVLARGEAVIGDLPAAEWGRGLWGLTPHTDGTC